MFKVGDSYKVKVEFPNGNVGFGRANILAKEGARFFVIVRNAREAKEHPPVGSRIYLVGNYQENVFNGLWSAKVVGQRIIDGATAVEISNPKFTPIQQRRRATRKAFVCPVMVVREEKGEEPIKANSRNISFSGIALESEDKALDKLLAGECVDISFKTKFGLVEAKCRTVRTEYNWLANRTDAGLEFVELEPKQKDLLEELLNSLGADEDETVDKGNMSAGLAGWMKGSKSDTKFVKKSSEESEGNEE
ncbi:MAG: PilZ domain-containing protein [Candidatus Obscuribacterales bacterium]|nr:PilZ domain-containing protein [Candidatus Obscuribacterales bacterium]